jgi:hypothetical protein
MANILKVNKVNLFVLSVLIFFWYNSRNFIDTPRMIRRVQTWGRPWPERSEEEHGNSLDPAASLVHEKLDEDDV